MTLIRFAILLGLLTIFVGCTSIAEIRNIHESSPPIPATQPTALVQELKDDCNTGSSTPADHAYSIEEYGQASSKYWAAYVEVDDEGWFFKDRNQSLNQLQAMQNRLMNDLHDENLKDTDFVVLAFIHGWHHNAHDDDCNVLEFRALLQRAQERYAAADDQDPLHRRHHRVIGIYVGWRGESLNIFGLRETTVFDRRNAAERIAKGDVRSLFALLRKDEYVAKQERTDRMHTIVIGHSYGGLIAFDGLSPSVLTELALSKPTKDRNCASTIPYPQSPGSKTESAAATTSNNISVFPDMLVLISPAFEAIRFEALHELMRPEEGCSFEVNPPKVVVLTSDSDWATGFLFTIERKAITLLEKYPAKSDERRSNEIEANAYAVGNIDRYRTHRLCLTAGKGPPLALFTPTEHADWPLKPLTPVWVVGAPPIILNGHSGFLYARYPSLDKPTPFLLDWLIDMNITGQASFAMPEPYPDARLDDKECPKWRHEWDLPGHRD